MFYIAGKEKQNKRTGLKEISEAIASPNAYTGKILQQLVKSKLLKSYKGPTGGFELVKDDIRLIDIVLAIDGDKILVDCVLGLPECGGENPCRVHDKFVKVRSKLKDTLLTADIRK